ncbi:lipase secretion chaperone [Litoribacillus peritrichatus]|uniref:Lipase chaperone n=1 Tax=Litoribacillus peritrichatus TaxID=718191 RepID=A0ABP7LZ01_9GAMM
MNKSTYTLLIPLLTVTLIVLATLGYWVSHPTTDSLEFSAQTAPITELTQQTSSEPETPKQTLERLNIREIQASAEDYYQPDSKTVRPEFAEMAPSLIGTDIDGQLATDSEGNLIIELDVRDTFDYFLNTIGQVPPEVAIAELRAFIDGKVAPPANEQAMGLLEDYLEYKAAALTVMSQPMIPAQEQTREYQFQVLASSLTQLQSLQEQYLSAEVNDAFFGIENSYADYTVQTMAIQLDNSLSSEQKAQQIMMLNEQLPEELSRSSQHLKKERTIAQTTTSLATADNRDAYLAHIEANYPSEKVAGIMADYDQSQQRNTRYQNYREELETLTHEGMQVSEIKAIEASLRQQYFSEHEQLIAASEDDRLRREQQSEKL